MISLKNISKAYEDNVVIRNLSLDIPENETTILMGASGCGKTTIANILLGLCKPDSGKVVGMNNRKLAAVFQEDRLSEKLSAIANVRIVLEKDMAKEEIIREFEIIDLDKESLAKPVSQLSGGQKRRVAIMRAMLAGGDFYCFDEPFRGLDEQTKRKTMRYVKDKIKGKTALIITHDESEAKFFDSNCIDLNQAKYHVFLPGYALDELAESN